MRKVTFAFAAIIAVTFAGNSFAGSLDNLNVNTNKTVSNSEAYSSSNARGGNARSSANNSGVNNSTRFQDKLQAPGLAVSGGYCQNAAGVSFPGGGFGFSFMERMCKVEIGARVARTYLGASPAAQYVCQQPQFSKLTVCRGGRR